jgi:O-antigen ligase
MNLILFLFIATFFSLSLGEFGQFPFGKTDFSISIMDFLLTLDLSALLIWNIAIKKNLKLPRNFLFLTVFWAIGILSLFFSLDLSDWLYLLRFIIYSSTFYLSFNLVKSRILSLDEFLTLIKITTVALGVLGLIQLILYPDLEILSALGYDPHKNRVFSTFLDPNLLGAFLNFGLVVLVYKLLNKKFTTAKEFLRENRLDLLWTTTLSAAVLLTFSRSTYLMLVVSLLIILAVKSRKLLAIFAGFVLVLYLVFPAFNARIQGAINIDRSASERFSSWDKGLLIFQENPIIGVGFNNIRNYSQNLDLIKLFSPDGGNSGAGVDSSLIFILATTGLVGFISFVLFLIRNLSDLVSSLTYNVGALYSLKFKPVKFMTKVLEIPGLSKWYKEGSGNNYAIKPNDLSLPLFALTAGLIANSFFINSLFFPPVMIIWFSSLGVFYGLGEEEGAGS